VAAVETVGNALHEVDPGAGVDLEHVSAFGVVAELAADAVLDRNCAQRAGEVLPTVSNLMRPQRHKQCQQRQQ
jgi:hypothetical protein